MIKKLSKISLVAVLALALVAGAGVGAAQATLTLGATTVDSGAALSLGTSTATSVDVSAAGIATTVKGTLNVDQAATFDTTVGVTGVTTHGGNVVSDTDSTDSLGTTGVRWASTFSDGLTGNTITLDGATGVNELRLVTNLADAFSIEDTAGDLMKFDTTTGTQVLTITPATTVTGLLTTSGGIANTGTTTGTSASASALAVGRQGATNPALQVDASTATSLTGLKVKSAGTGAGLALSVVETDGTNNALTIDAMGSGKITIGDTSTGNIELGDASGSKAVVIVPATGNTTIPGTLGVTGITTFGNTATAGLLLGSGADGLANAHSIGASGGKAMSFYLKSTSQTASDVTTGLYVNTYYGTAADAAAPSGDSGRFRAYLTGDASGTSALTGSASTVEMAAGSTNTGLTNGTRGNLVLPDGTIGTSGTFAGVQAELYSGGTSTDVTGVTSVSPLRIVVDGGAGFTLSKWTNVPAMRIDVPSAMVAATGTVMLDTTPTGVTPTAKLKINVNGTDYWILLTTGD